MENGNANRSYDEKVYLHAMKNTKYNGEGKAVIEVNDEWREEKEWDAIFAQTSNVLFHKITEVQQSISKKINPARYRHYSMRGRVDGGIFKRMKKMRIKEEKMTKVLVVEYEVFEDIGETVLTVVDREKDEALNMFNGENADKMYKLLVGKDIKEK